MDPIITTQVKRMPLDKENQFNATLFQLQHSERQK